MAWLLIILLFFFPLFYEGREKGKRITKVVIKSHAFLLDLTFFSMTWKDVDLQLNIGFKSGFGKYCPVFLKIRKVFFWEIERWLFFTHYFLHKIISNLVWTRSSRKVWLKITNFAFLSSFLLLYTLTLSDWIIYISPFWLVEKF